MKLPPIEMIENLLTPRILPLLYSFVYDRFLTQGKGIDEICGLLLSNKAEWTRAFVGQDVQQGPFHLDVIEKKKLDGMLSLFANAESVKQELWASIKPDDLRIMILTEPAVFFVDVSLVSHSPILTVKDGFVFSTTIRYAGGTLTLVCFAAGLVATHGSDKAGF